MPDIFDEVEEDLRAERARCLARRFAGTAAAAVVLILAGTGSFVYWQQKRIDAANAVADRFIGAARQADLAARNPSASRADAKQAAATLADIADHGPAGYRVLARLRLAALDWDTGQHAQAIGQWQSVSDDTSATALLRDLATLTSAQHQLDAGDVTQQKQRLQTLTGQDNPWRPMAEQTIALIDIKTGRTGEGAAILRRLTTDQMAPEGVRGMAADLLTTLPAAPASPPAQPQAAPHG